MFKRRRFPIRSSCSVVGKGVEDVSGHPRGTNKQPASFFNSGENTALGMPASTEQMITGLNAPALST